MTEYTKPLVWKWEDENDNRSGNRPTAGSRFEQALPKGEKSFQVYSLGTPNGIKVAIMLEELKELGISEADYDLFLINIGQGDQFGSDFVAINPNSKIPAMVDYSEQEPISVFESANILLYLAEKFDAFYQKLGQSGQRFLIGSSGKLAPLHLLVEDLDISSITLRQRKNIRLIAIQWKLSVS